LVLRDGRREKRGESIEKAPNQLSPLIHWLCGLHIPGTMIYFNGSRFAETAAVTEASIARFYGMAIAVISVTKPGYVRERRGEAEQAVKRALEHMQSEGITAAGTVLHGQPAELVASVAREKDANLIVTGSHTRTGLERVLLGSTSERILNATPCAALVVNISWATMPVPSVRGFADGPDPLKYLGVAFLGVALSSGQPAAHQKQFPRSSHGPCAYSAGASDILKVATQRPS
jgi:nucleotide-binding universal stress UspA family protein